MHWSYVSFALSHWNVTIVTAMFWVWGRIHRCIRIHIGCVWRKYDWLYWYKMLTFFYYIPKDMYIYNVLILHMQLEQRSRYHPYNLYALYSCKFSWLDSEALFYWWLYHDWRYWKLMIWQPSVTSGMKGCCLDDFLFQWSEHDWEDLCCEIEIQ